MSPEQTEPVSSAASDQSSGYDAELMRLYHQTNSICRALMSDEEIDKVMALLETCAKYG